LFDLYRQEIETRFDIRSGIVQPSHFCIARSHRGASLLPKLLLFREILRTAVREQAGFVACVVKNQPARLRFHNRMGFTQIGPAKLHPLANREVVLIGTTTRMFLSAVRADEALQVIGDFETDATFEQAQIGGPSWRSTM
jgi:hypothetical protein